MFGNSGAEVQETEVQEVQENPCMTVAIFDSTFSFASWAVIETGNDIHLRILMRRIIVSF